MRNTIATFFLLASIASAQTLESWTVDTDKAVPKPLVIRRGETRDLRVTFKTYSAAAAIPTNASVQLWYRSADISNGLYYVITGSVHSAAAGVARVLWTAAHCGAATNYTWDLVVLSNTTPYNLRAYGTIQLQAGVFSQATTQTNPATYLALDWARIVNINTNAAPFGGGGGGSDPDAVTNGGARLTAGADISLSSTSISNGANITIAYTGAGASGGVSAATATGIAYAVVGEWATTGTASKAITASNLVGAQSNRIEMALTNAADFYPASNPSGYQTAAQVQGAAATVAGGVFESFIGNPYSYRGTFTGHVFATSGNVLTNAAAFATAAQGTKADTAMQPAATNGWEIGSHTGLVTQAQTNGWEIGSHTGLVTQAQTNGWEIGSHTGLVTKVSTNGAEWGSHTGLVTRTMTNGWEIGSHANLATNAGGAGAGYYAMSNGAWTAFAPGAGESANAVTNGGARLVAGADISLSSTILSNGANITIAYTGAGSSGGVSAATATGIAYAVVGEWATTGTASKAITASNLVGAQSNALATALQPASTQNLATVTHLATATNAAVVDATNRVAGVGYLLPASTQNLATVAQVAAATNGIDAGFISSKGGLTNPASGFATTAQGVAATNAQARVAVVETNTVTLAMTNGWVTGSHTGFVAKVDTNGWVITSHATFLTAETDPVFNTNGVKIADTNGWEIGSHTGLVTRTMTNGWEIGAHTSFATNAGGAGAGYYAMSNGAWTAFAPGAGGSANAVTNGGARIDGQAISNGASITTSGGMSGATVTNIVIAVGTAQGWSTNTAWTWQGAQIVPVETSAYTVAYGGPAVWNEGSNRYDVLPYTTTNYGTVTGSVTITMASNAYLTSVGGTWYIKARASTLPQEPVSYSLVYSTSTSAVMSAWCSTNPADAVSDYFAYFSNLVVYGYDRTSMSTYQYTNDAAGIVARVDSLPEGNTDTRRVVNADSLASAIAAAKPDIAKEAWNYTPSGARQPNYSVLTIDKPLVQQQAGIVYMQAGNYFAQSYRGVWDNTVTGSVWRVGPSGRMAFEITSTNIGLAISAFSIVTNTAFFTIETNGVVGTPYLEYSADLVAAQWLIAPGQSMVNNTTNWTASCPTVATMLFFRAISPGGANAINSHYRHVFMAGVSGITAADVGAVSNGGATINGQALTNGAALTISGSGVSAAEATNIVASVVSLAPIKITDARFYLAGLSNAAQSVRAKFSVSQKPNNRCTDLVFLFTNQLYYSVTSTVAGVADAFTNVVNDASGFIINDMYTKPDASQATWQTVSNASATVVSWNCSNMVATAVGITISRVNRFRVPDYYDATGGSNIFCNLQFLTSTTQTVAWSVTYWSRTNFSTATGSQVVTNSAAITIPYVK